MNNELREALPLLKDAVDRLSRALSNIEEPIAEPTEADYAKFFCIIVEDMVSKVRDGTLKIDHPGDKFILNIKGINVEINWPLWKALTRDAVWMDKMSL